MLKNYSRRDFLKITGKGLGFAALSSLPLSLAACDPDRYFYFAVIADPHIIDEFYKGPESNKTDTESIFKANSRYEHARDVINSLTPAIDLVMIPGDYVHNYPSDDWNFYFQNRTRFDIAKELSDGFKMPVYPGLGNHDYDVPKISREFTHELILEKWAIKPYYSVDHKGWKFIHLNNFLGSTFDKESPDFNDMFGSFGEEQLLWLDEQLKENKPSFVFFHYPMILIKPYEVADLDVFSVLYKHKANVKMVISGHMHRWMNFGSTLGVQHFLCASTRYDEDSFMIFEIDKQTQDIRMLNWPCYVWLTTQTLPYDRNMHKVAAKQSWIKK